MLPGNLLAMFLGQFAAYPFPCFVPHSELEPTARGFVRQPVSFRTSRTAGVQEQLTGISGSCLPVPEPSGGTRPGEWRFWVALFLRPALAAGRAGSGVDAFSVLLYNTLELYLEKGTVRWRRPQPLPGSALVPEVVLVALVWHYFYCE